MTTPTVPTAVIPDVAGRDIGPSPFTEEAGEVRRSVWPAANPSPAQRWRETAARLERWRETAARLERERTKADPANPKDLAGETKAPLHLVPPSLALYASAALKNGAEKYGPYNWREHPVKAHVYIAAALRHLLAWFDGEDDAPDSGVSHLAHAVAGLAVLIDAEATGNLVDDRPTPGAAGRLIEESVDRPGPVRSEDLEPGTVVRHREGDRLRLTDRPDGFTDRWLVRKVPGGDPDGYLLDEGHRLGALGA